MQISTIGFDLAKNVFQVHGVDATGKVMIKKQAAARQMLALFEKVAALPRRHGSVRHVAPLGTRAQRLGHDVRLMPASYVKAYVKRGKNDAADAAAICEAVTRPSMRFVPIKSAEQ